MNDIYKQYLDTQHSLLDKFRQIAPGTFKHCQNVTAMVETVSVELELDVDLMKCCAMYHDIGKINNPSYFSENQSAKENIHDSLDAKTSCKFITSHVADGVMILLQNDFPSKVINIVGEHHGDTVLRQFHKNDETSPEDYYRYKSRKPSCPESVVLMIVDSVEATSRSEFMRRKDVDENGDHIDKIVQDTINRLDGDDQLDNVVHGLIKKVKRILIKELESIYHKRVSYKDDDSPSDEA